MTALLQGQQLGQWVEQPIAVPVRGLMGISMADTGRGYAVGDVDVLLGQTGILVKNTGDPTWHPVPASAFSPALNISLTSWAQDVYAIPRSSVAFVSWRDDYRSLVYKTVDGGTSWFSVSPLNPILYGTRFAVTFKDVREGMIVGEGPGRVHRTMDGGISWTNYTIPVRAALTDVKFSGSFWNVMGGENAYFRYLPTTQRWINLSFTHSVDFFPTHLKMSFVDDNYAFACGYNSGTGNHIIKTNDGGLFWNPIPGQPSFNSSPEGHKGIHFFDTLKGWVASNYDEFAYTDNGGHTWSKYKPLIFGNKTYRHVNKLVFINEAFGWAVGGIQRTDGYPSVSAGWIFRWRGTQRPDISGSPVVASFDTLSCADYKDLTVPIFNQGTGNLTIASGGVTFQGSGFTLRNTSFPFIVAPGQTREMYVRWQPAAGYYGPVPSSSAMMIESSDADHTPWRIALTGLRLLADLQPTQARLLFPTTCLGDSALAGLPVVSHGNVAPRILEVKNIGRGLISPVSHLPGDTVATVDTIWFALGGSLDGAMSGELQVLAGDTACPELLTIPFEGYIESNTLKLTPDILDFKDVCVGTEETEFLEVKNLGTQEGRILRVLFVEGDPGFSVDADTTQMIAPGMSTQLRVRFAPPRPDSLARAAAFRLVVGPCPDTLTLMLEGRGYAPTFRLDPDSLLVIGPVPLNIDVHRSIGLENTGRENVTLSGVKIEPPVPGLTVLAPANFPMQFNTGDSIGVKLVYRAQVKDSITTQVRITWSDPCPDTLVLPLVLVSDELPYAVHPDSLLFAEQICEDAVLDSFEVRNAGQEALLVRRTDITGRDPAHFRLLAPPLPLLLPADSSAFFVLAYDAPANGESRAELHLSHNDSTVFGESVVRLIGRRSVRTLTVEGDTLRPLALCVGTADTRRFVFRNSHDAPLQLTGITLERGAPFVTLHHNPLPASVAPGQTFQLNITVRVPLDTIIPVVIRATMEPCRVEYLLRFDAGVYHPAIRVQPDPLNLGIRSLSDSSRISVRVQNADSIDVEIDSVFLTDVSGALFIATAPAWPVALEPDSLLALQLKLRLVKDTGTFAGTLCVRLSLPCPDTLCFPIGTIISDAGLTADVDTLDYAFAFCDSLHCDTVTVTNALTAAQVLQAVVTNPAVFSVTPDSAVVLESGRSIQFIVCSRRPVALEARGELLVSGDGGGLAVVQLYARREAGGLQFPDTLDAGNLPSCETSREFSLRIENTASMDEDVLGAVISGSGFTLLTQPPFHVRGGGSVTLRLRYDPPAPGAHSGQLSLSSRIGGCDRTTVIEIAGRFGQPYLDITPSTLLFANVVAGSSQTRSLRIRNRDMQDLHLFSAHLQPAPPFSATVSAPMPFDTGAVLDIPVTFLPDSVGSSFGTLCLIFDKPCPDTVCVSLEGVAIDGDLIFTTPVLRFDTLAQCGSQTVTAVLRNSGSADVLLKGNALGGPGAAAFTVLDPVTSDETLQAGGSRNFRVAFDPSSASDGPVHATLFISTDAAKQPVVELPLEGMRVTQSTPPTITVVLGDILLGSPFTISADGVNTGSAHLQVRSYGLPATYSAIDALPHILPAQQTFSLRFSFAPVDEGSFADTLLAEIGPCSDTLLIVVVGVASRPYEQTDVDYLQVPVCDIREGVAQLINNSEEDMDVLAMTIEGAFASRYAFVSPPATPFPLPAGSTRSVAIRFTPAPGDVGDTGAELRTDLRIDGQQHSFRSRLIADVFDGGIDFTGVPPLGSAPLGEESAVIAVVGRNNSAFPVDVAEVFATSPRLRIVDTQPALPARILPGDSLVLRLTFTPDTQGWIDDSLSLRATSPCAVELRIPLRFEGRGDLIPVEISSTDVHGAVDDTVTIPILLSRDVSGLGITAWSGKLTFDRSMLYPIAVQRSGTMSAAMRVQWEYDARRGEVSFTADSGRLAVGTALLTLHCLVLVGGDSVCALQPVSYNFSHPAITVTDMIPGRFRLDDYCFAGGARLLDAADSTANLGSIVPNPVTALAVIPVTLAEAASVRLSIVDARGREVAVVHSGELLSGRNELQFDASTLSAGSYLMLLRSDEGLQSRRMTVVR
jgi:hypothetical protein